MLGWNTNVELQNAVKLVINLKDAHYNIEIDLHYIVLEDVDLIERYTVVKNNEEKDSVDF